MCQSEAAVCWFYFLSRAQIQNQPELSFNPELQVNLMLCEIGFLFSLLEEEGCSYRNSLNELYLYVFFFLSWLFH